MLKRSGKKSHHLVVANDSHDTQGLDAIVLRVEGRVWSAAIAVVGRVAEDNVRVVVGVQVADVVSLDIRVLLDQALERSGGLRVGRATASSIAFVGLVTIAVDVHVCEAAIVAVDVDGARLLVFAVGECCNRERESSAEILRSRTSLANGPTVRTITTASALVAEAAVVEAVLEVHAAIALSVLHTVVERLDVAWDALAQSSRCQKRDCERSSGLHN